MFVSMFLINILMPLIMIEKSSDYYISLNIIYGSFFMASSMVLSMSLIMKLSYSTLLLNSVILIVSYLGIRNQWLVNDSFFLRDMIPHHSMALQTSKYIKERTNDPKIQELANTIYNSQTKEIQYMKTYLYVYA
jgi:hypothetical protein